MQRCLVSYPLQQPLRTRNKKDEIVSAGCTTSTFFARNPSSIGPFLVKFDQPTRTDLGNVWVTGACCRTHMVLHRNAYLQKESKSFAEISPT
jgi:hypothetical protein